MPVSHHVLGQLLYPFGEQGYLNLSRAGILFLEPKFAYNFGLFLFVQIIFLYFQVILANIGYNYKLTTDYNTSVSDCKLLDFVIQGEYILLQSISQDKG
jgi:hypothetical protein